MGLELGPERRPLIEEVEEQGRNEGEGEGEGEECATAGSCGTHGDGDANAAGIPNELKSFPPAPLLLQSLCLGLSLELPAKGIAAVSWIEDQDQDQDCDGDHDNDRDMHMGEGVVTETSHAHAAASDSRFHALRTCSLVAVGGWDGTVRLVRACLQ